MEDLYRMPGHLVRRVQQIASALFLDECGSFDLTSVQFAALKAIQSHPRIDATRLSSLIAIDRSTLGSVLERLEKKGWVVRSSSPTDKRTKLLSLSPEGREVLKQVIPAVRRVQKRLVAPLASTDQEKIVQLLHQIAEAYNDLLPAPIHAASPD
ncbi:MAG: MarR family transcriptional regulator [Xanthobacteraceae bacterium]|nr:MarR family transcriptional regulator [Xanthobacteraceae bacterium]